MFAEGTGIAFLDDILFFNLVAKLVQQGKGLLGADDYGFRVTQQHFLEGSGMVGFHVVDNHEVQRTAL